eukprot:scpid32291/ scgid25245/ Transposon Ty3-G Gag-Pol polyprotein; Gag3-Pol3; Transposon Ty3-1 TYA-TYB polyprotein; Capsid protein; p24; Spacer peptide p3; Nucleocapsid protein p11; Ty3 protease; p16; Spacer peptide J; Reverse transcriptase/ribonuclease H; p55; Integrase p61; Integrase p58
MSRFQPPCQFDFADPSAWDDWLDRFRQYRKVTKLHKDDEDVQVATLLYSMGPQATVVHKQLKFDDAGDAEKFDEVVKKMSEYFKPVSNVVHERTMFERAIQSPSESVDEYLRRLHRIADKCDFSGARDERIRDRFMANLIDRKLTLELQLLDKPDLAKAATYARNYEQVHRQVAAQRHQLEVSAPPQAAGISTAKANSGGRAQQFSSTRRSTPFGTDDASCRWCGRPATHSRRECPARSEKCSSCGKTGHFSRVCLSKPSRLASEPGAGQKLVHAVQPTPTADISTGAYLFMGGVSTDQLPDEPWMRFIPIGNTEVLFKVDTGADTSVMNADTFSTLVPSPTLQTPAAALLGPDGTPLTLAGKFTVLSRDTNGQLFPHDVHVLSASGANLLSRQASFRMGFVQPGVHNVSAPPAPPLGCMTGPPVSIRLLPDARPYHCPVARRVPFPLLQKVKKELTNMVDSGIITPVTEPTEWCAPMVAVRKKNGDVRICVDLKRLNTGVKRETFVLPTVEETMAKLSGATVFSTLDTKKGFWQVPLADESQHLTTFITPFGRYKFRRLPFGISSAPEIFQRKLMGILDGIPGVVVFMDDILIFGSSQEAHDTALTAVYQALAQANVTLNPDKSQVGRASLKFLGHSISHNGVRPDPDRISALLDLAAPTDVPSLRRVLGLFNYIGKFLPGLASVSTPLRALLRHNTVWCWDAAQRDAFAKMKELAAAASDLAFFDPSQPVVISADASSYGLGAALWQRDGDDLRPIAFASKSLNETQQRYAQIEKELLAVTWACDHFQQYIRGGLPFEVHTDHKPLIPLINSRDLDNVPLRCQRMLMRLLQFSVTATYVPGPRLVVADALSRSPSGAADPQGSMQDLLDDIDIQVASVSAEYASPTFQDRIRAAVAEDPVVSDVAQRTLSGWPERARDVPPALLPFYPARSCLSVANGIVYFNTRIVIPRDMQPEVLRTIHDGHQGVTKCRARARTAVWWPGLDAQIADVVQTCEACSKERLVPAAPLLPQALPARPWQRLAVDLFHFEGHDYLLTVDYFSRFIEVDQLKSTTSHAVIAALSLHFARYGTPEGLVSDNGPQFSSDEFALFLARHSIQHRTSSPRYPQSNGMAERAVRTIKEMLRKDPDLPSTLLAYRSTPLQSGPSPAQLLMGRRIQSSLPLPESALAPEWPDLIEFRRREVARKSAQADTFDDHHAARAPSPLGPGDRVWLVDLAREGTVKERLSERSFLVTSAGSVLRRNVRNLRPLPQRIPDDGPILPIPAPSDAATPVERHPAVATPGAPDAAATADVDTTRSGRAVRPPDRLDL